MSDIYETVTNQIVAALEAGIKAGDYKTPWTGGHATHRPLNAIGRNPYRGVNVLALWASAEVKGYTSGEWATYKQWAEAGAQVRKGEKSTHIVFFKKMPDGTNEAGEPTRGGMLAKAYFVFNASQVENYTPKDAPAPLSDDARDAAADAFFANTGATIVAGGGACYIPSQDLVKMPAYATFHDAAGYYSTLAHELTHWTGASKRLDRNLRGRFGDEAYAAEELIAELGSAFTMANLSLSTVARQDHAAYIASWIKVLKNDKRAIFTAASYAQKAADYLAECSAVPFASAA